MSAVERGSKIDVKRRALRLQGPYPLDDGDTRSAPPIRRVLHAWISENALRIVGSDLINNHNMEGRVEFKVEGNLKIGIMRAIPCSLIINELISNSLNYAFPNRQRRARSRWLFQRRSSR